MILAKTAWRKRGGDGGTGPAPGAPGLPSPSTPPASSSFAGLAWSKLWSWLLTLCLGDCSPVCRQGTWARGAGEKGMPCCCMMALFWVEEAAV